MTSEGFSEERSADVVAASFDGTPDPRLREVMQSLVRHLHAFVKDVKVIADTVGAAIDDGGDDLVACAGAPCCSNAPARTPRPGPGPRRSDCAAGTGG